MQVKITKQASADTNATLGSLKTFVTEAEAQGAPNTAILNINRDGRRNPARMTLTVIWTVGDDTPGRKP